MKTKRVVSIVCIVLVLVLIASLVLSAVGGAFAVSQAQIDELKRQRTEIADEKKRLGEQIGSLESKMDSVLEQKAALDRQNELARQEIEMINEEIALYEELVEVKAIELEEAIAREEAQKEALRMRMRRMEELGGRSYFSYITILFKATSFTDLLARIDSVNSIMNRDKQLEDAYIAARENVEVVKAEYEETLARHEATKIELEAKKAQLEREIQEAYLIIVELEKDIERFKKEFEENEAAEAALSDEINKMVAEMERQRKEAEAAAAAAGKPGNSVVGSGKYVFPLPGGSAAHPPSNSYGMRMHPIFNEMRMHYGEDYGATSGTSIYAIDAGTVAVATYSSSYGNYVVISHGNGISSTYAHMSSMAVTAGQTVKQGETIGYVGSTGWSTGPHLHLEIRVNGTTVDPKTYVS